MLVNARVVENHKVTKDCYRMKLDAPEVAQRALPGQFIHVRCNETTESLDPLLRRPFSINAVDRKKGRVALLYRVVGRGTSFLARKRIGESINLIGPLGKGFSFSAVLSSIIVVGGGIGIAPLFFLLQELSLKNIPSRVFFGARSQEELYLLAEIEKMGFCVQAATDDGSLGHKGTVISLLKEKLCAAEALKKPRGIRPEKEHLSFNPAFVYGCGPEPMLRELSRLLNELQIPGEISLEERMGCGVGACLSCVCKIKNAEKNEVQQNKQQNKVNENFIFRRVCSDGPVFSVSEVIFDN